MNFNFPILTEEESSRPVTWGEVKILLETMFKTIAEHKEREGDAICNSVEGILDTIVDQLKDIKYQQFKDTKFFICLLHDLGYGSIEYLTKYYITWCEEFDKLNKVVSKDESKTNC
jgi:hypothetical protein